MTPEQRRQLAAAWRAAAIDESASRAAAEALSELDLSESLIDDASFWIAWLEPWSAALQGKSDAFVFPEPSVETLRRLYTKQTDARVRGRIAALWASLGGASAIEALIDAYRDAPPTNSLDAALGLSPLVKKPETARGAFPGLLDALAHRSAAAAVLDVANFLYDRRGVEPHPAVERQGQLAELLGGVTQQLFLTAERPEETQSPGEAARQFDDAAALMTSLCRTASLLRTPSLLQKLHSALELPHRRLRLTVASALAACDEEPGVEALIELAAEPSVRRAVLHSLAEVGRLDEAAAEHRTPLALAEADIAAFLAAPAQFGLPPSDLECVDERDLAWPGWDEPQTCRLYRYEYQFPVGAYSNVAIATPVCDAPTFDLTTYSTEDAYAYFAGRNVEHPAITTQSPDDVATTLEPRQRQLLRVAGFLVEGVLLVGEVFGAGATIVQTRRDDARGLVLLDEQDRWEWFPDQTPQPSPTPRDVFDLFAGRKLLSQFNPGFSSSENH